MASRDWAWRIQESLAFGNGRWHMLVCPFCRGGMRWAREQEKRP